MCILAGISFKKLERWNEIIFLQTAFYDNVYFFSISRLKQCGLKCVEQM